MRYPAIDKSFFVDNRNRLMSKISKNSMAILHSNDEMPRNGDLYFRFRQSSDLFYLTGLDQPKVILLLFPDHPEEQFREVVFTQKTSEQIAIWEGNKYTKERARDISGVTTIYWLEEFEDVFHKLMQDTEKLFFNRNDNVRYSSDVPSKDVRFLQEVRKQYPEITYTCLAPFMKELRIIKRQVEVDLIRKACAITSKAFNRVLKTVKPGLMEYEVEAEITYEFMKNGANGHAYHPIVASGKNALCLHYSENNDRLEDGDLLLLDFGAEYANYASDLSRTIPVIGRYNQRQRACYQAVLEVMKQARQMLVVGTTIETYHKEVCTLMEEKMIALGLFSLEDAKKQDPEKPLFFKYYMHGTSHFMGLDTHDLGDKDIPLQPGMLFSCEPGIYIQEEGIGIRIENDILVTENGPVDLMSDIPIEIDEIEEIMKTM